MSNAPLTPELVEDELPVKSIAEYLTPKLRDVFDNLPMRLREIPVVDLEVMIEPTVLMKRLKIGFWREYRKTIVEGRTEISIISTYENICSKQHFYEHMVYHNDRFAWLLHPPVEYEIKVEEALDYGIDKVRKMLEAPLFAQKADGSQGLFLKDNAALILRAVQFLDQRVKGSPLQRIENKSLHIHSHQTVNKLTKEDMDRELLEIRAKLNSGTQALQISGSEEPE